MWLDKSPDSVDRILRWRRWGTLRKVSCLLLHVAGPITHEARVVIHKYAKLYTKLEQISKVGPGLSIVTPSLSARLKINSARGLKLLTASPFLRFSDQVLAEGF